MAARQMIVRVERIVLEKERWWVHLRSQRTNKVFVWVTRDGVATVERMRENKKRPFVISVRRINVGNFLSGVHIVKEYEV